MQLKTVRESQLQAPLGCAYSLRSIGLGNIGALRLVFEGLHLAPHPSPALLLSDRQQRTAVILPLADDTYRKTHHSAVLAIAAERLSRKRDAHIRHQRRVALGLPEGGVLSMVCTLYRRLPERASLSQNSRKRSSGRRDSALPSNPTGSLPPAHICPASQTLCALLAGARIIYCCGIDFCQVYSTTHLTLLVQEKAEKGLQRVGVAGRKSRRDEKSRPIGYRA